MKFKEGVSGFQLIGLGMVGLGLTQSANATTQVTFGSFTANNIEISTIPGYGSNVTGDSADYVVSPGVTGITGTPDIGLTWGSGYQTYTEWDGRGNVAQTDFNAAVDLDLTFTPSASSGVLINSFDLDAWAGGGDISVNWSISDSAGTLSSGVWVRTTGGRDTISTGLNAGDVQLGEAVTLRLTLNSGSPSYIAMANLTFDQVPEPSTLALCAAGLGLGALAIRRRRK